MESTITLLYYTTIGIAALLIMACQPEKVNGKFESPIPGGSGVLTFGAVTSSSITVSWQLATDNVSAQSALSYEVVYSLSNNVQTAGAAQGNGTVVQDWTQNISTVNATGLSSGTPYYFNVLVKDGAGNTSAYAQALSQLHFGHMRKLPSCRKPYI